MSIINSSARSLAAAIPIRSHAIRRAGSLIEQLEEYRKEAEEEEKRKPVDRKEIPIITSAFFKRYSYDAKRQTVVDKINPRGKMILKPRSGIPGSQFQKKKNEIETEEGPTDISTANESPFSIKSRMDFDIIDETERKNLEETKKNSRLEKIERTLQEQLKKFPLILLIKTIDAQYSFEKLAKKLHDFNMEYNVDSNGFDFSKKSVNDEDFQLIYDTFLPRKNSLFLEGLLKDKVDDSLLHQIKREFTEKPSLHNRVRVVGITELGLYLDLKIFKDLQKSNQLSVKYAILNTQEFHIEKSVLDSFFGTRFGELNEDKELREADRHFLANFKSLGGSLGLDKAEGNRDDFILLSRSHTD